MTPEVVAEEPQETASTPTKSSVVKMVPIDRITVNPALQVCGGVSPERVARYEEIIKEHGLMDPLDAFYEDPITKDTVFSLADGFHRIAAYRNCEIAKIPVTLRSGTVSDAILFALRKNGRHGVQMTNAEKRHACEVAVLDPVVGELTDLKIAKMIGCSASLVASARRGESKEEAGKKAKQRSARSTGATQNAVSVSAHTRKSPNAAPTKAMILRQVEDYLKHDVIDEKDLIGLMEAKDASYFWTRKPGHEVTLRVVGKSGREQVSVKVLVKEISLDVITLKSEEAKLGVLE